MSRAISSLSPTSTGPEDAHVVHTSPSMGQNRTMHRCQAHSRVNIGVSPIPPTHTAHVVACVAWTEGLSNQRLPLAWASRSWTRHELGAGIRFFPRTGKMERETCHNEVYTAGRRPRFLASWNPAGSLRRAPSPAPLQLCTLPVTCLTTRATAQKRDTVTPN